ncbi:MAG: ATP-binding protein [Bacteroidota bacterium]
MADSYVWSVYEDPGGALWIGTEGGLSRFDQGQFTNFAVGDGLPSSRIIAVRGTQDGTLWAGTHSAGLVQYASGQFSTYTTDDGLPSPSVYALYEDRSGTLWIGTGGGLVRYNPGAERRFTTFTTDDGLSSNLITVVAEDAAGCLLVGTYDGGLNTLCGETVVRQTTKASGLPSDLVLSLYVDGEGVVWAGLLGGLARIEGGAVHTFTTDDGLYSDEVLHLFEDEAGTFWLSSNRGLFRVPKSSLTAAARGQDVTVASISYGRVTGQRTLEFNGGVQPAGWHSADGTLWLPTTEGVISLRPEDMAALPVPAPHLDAFLVDGTSASIGGPLLLPPGGSRYHFRFAAPRFVAPERLRYRYRLDGVDAGWTEGEGRHEAFYTNLPPGPYTFRVQAVDEDGRVSETRSLAFEIEPHFYQSLWFLGPALLGLTGLLYLLYLLRVRYLVARQRALERLVEARTADLREANHRLAETSELKSHLMHMVAHDLKNPLNGVHEIAKLLKMELPPDAPQQEFVTLVEDAAEQMLALVLRFLDAEALDSDTLNIELQAVDMAAAARAAAGRFQAAAERKDQRIAVETSTETPFAQADPAWLQEVLDNLVSNAVKFTPSGKHIWIGVSCSQDAGGARSVRFSVRDEGPGLTQDDLDKLFGKFQRLSARPTGGESSSGLGLSIVQRVAELLGGRVWAENAPEGGSLFVVELPASEPAPAERSAPASIAPDDDTAVDEFDLGGVLIGG